LVKASREREAGDCVCAEALKAEIEIARFSWGAVNRFSGKTNGVKSLTSCVLFLKSITKTIELQDN
jgi:hypothetical protein